MARSITTPKFKNLYPQYPDPEMTFFGLKPALLVDADEGNIIAANHKFFALALAGREGPLLIHSLKNPTSFGSKVPVINVHERPVTDIDFNPFVGNIVATGSDDNKIKITKFPMEGLTEDIKEATVSLEGHSKRVIRVQFHPTAENVLLSAGADGVAKVWDVITGAEMYKNSESSDRLQHACWNRNGSLIATTSRDRSVRLFDIRSSSAAASVTPFDNSKIMRVQFLDNHNLISVTGMTSAALRKLLFFDPRKLGEAFEEVELGKSYTDFDCHYDEDNSILYLGAREETKIRAFQISPGPRCQLVSETSSFVAQRSFCFVTKPACDFMKCEIATCLRALPDRVEPVRFVVAGRSSEVLQSDLFPDTNSYLPQINAESWSKGENADPVLKPIKEVSERLNAV